MNSFLLTVAVLLVVVLSALFAVPYVVDVNDYRPLLETQASKLLGRQVRVDGRVQLSLLPVPELRFDQVAVADSQGRFDQPFLQAKALEASLNIGSLLRGEIEARDLTITDPVLRLTLKPDGTGNWSDIGSGAKTLPFVPRNIAFDSVHVTGGRVLLTKQGAGTLALDQLSGTASAESLFGPYKVDVSYSVDGKPQSLRFATAPANADGSFHLKSTLEDQSRQATILLDGIVSGLGTVPRYKGSLTADVMPPAPSKKSAKPAAPLPPGAPAIATPVTGQGAEATVSQPMSNAAAEQAAGMPLSETALVDLKGTLTATPNHVALDDFDLTIHTGGRSQMAKGKLAFGFGATHSATAEIKARWLDIDALLGPGGKKEPTPAGLLGKLAGLGLAQAARFDRSALQLKVDQASLGGDLVTDVDLDLKGNKREIEIDKLIAGLPGDSHIDTHGKLTEQGGAPQFDGAVKLGGAKLRTVTRWALGDRELAGQASSGAFSLAANVSIAPADIQLANVKGALSGTSFSGALRYHDGERPSLYATLDSNRLDLRDLIGEPGSWSLWSKTSPGSGEKKTTGTRQGLIAALGKTEMHVALRVGKLLLPKTQGALDANFAYANGNLSIGKLDFKSPGAISLNGSGEIDQLVSSSASGSASASAPSGQVNFALSGQKPESLAFLAKLLGLPDTVADKDYLARLAPLDLHVALKADHAANKPELTADISGKAKAADIAVKASIAGDLSKLADADITLHGGITGAPPQVLLPILFPGTADAALTARLAQASGEESNFNLALSGVPAKSMTGSATLSGPLTISVNGQGALQNDALTMHARLGAKTADAGLLVGLTGLKVSPAARAVPLDLNGTLTSKTGEIALSSISGTVGQQHVAGSIRLLRHKKQKPELFLDLSGDTVSLPGLLGTLIAWDRSPSTEAILGTLTQGASAVWPVRGFALDPLADANSHINVKAKTLLLGSAFPLTDASLEADADESGLKVRSLDGELFDGTFTASGKLVPRGAGAHFEGQAKLSKAELVPALTAIAGKPLASSRFDLRFNLAGDGLSPAGLVAGLSGGGLLTLSKGRIQSLNADALRRMVAGAARADKNAVNEERVTALGKALRKQIFSGSFPFAATSIAFDIANGTVRVDHAALVNREATAGIEGYLALASLKLDSEWKLQLNAKAASDIPPVGLVLAGPLDQPGGVIATVDSKPVESYFTVERMQQDVERLENLDVTGQGDGADQAAPSRQSTNGSGAVNSPPPIPQRAPGYPGTSQQSASGGRVLTDPQPRRTVRPRPPPQPHNDWRNGFGLFGGG